VIFLTQHDTLDEYLNKEQLNFLSRIIFNNNCFTGCSLVAINVQVPDQSAFFLMNGSSQ